MKKGFTLIELLVIIAITGILTSIVIASLGESPDEDDNYRICGSGECYNVESYTKESNCVFMAENEVRVCGDYTITKLNIEE